MSANPQHPDSQLRRRRDQLAEEVTELHWNLGGLTYEMAIRDHFRLDVLIRRAAMLQERDAELAQVERMLHMQESASAGNCHSCGAMRSRGAVFCWQCGAQVMERKVANDNGQQNASHPIGLSVEPVEAVEPVEPVKVAEAGGAVEPDGGEQTQPPDGLGRPIHTSS